MVKHPFLKNLHPLPHILIIKYESQSRACFDVKLHIFCMNLNWKYEFTHWNLSHYLCFHKGEHYLTVVKTKYMDASAISVLQSLVCSLVRSTISHNKCYKKLSKLIPKRPLPNAAVSSDVSNTLTIQWMWNTKLVKWGPVSEQMVHLARSYFWPYARRSLKRAAADFVFPTPSYRISWSTSSNVSV